jgi:hypothetical protein
MFTKFSLLAAVVSFGLFVGGCAAQSDDAAQASDSDLSASQIEITPGTFDLFSAPKGANVGCSIKTILTLTTDGNTAHASLKNVSSGICAVYVMPDVREFDLKLDSSACGSDTFSGESIVNGVERHVSITDNRGRSCRDFVPAKIVLEETDATNAQVTRYTQN